MYIYFIRHGETEYNRKRVHQDGTVALSDKGRAQVLKAADALKKLPITKLITSDYARALESAEIISRTLGLMPEEHPLFREVKYPSELHHKPKYGLETVRIGTQMLAHLYDPSWHYHDEENLYDLKKRVAEGVEFLKRLTDEHEHVAIVSHGFILALFIKYMCAYNDVRVRDYLKTLFRANGLKNASISTVMFNDDGNSHTCDWMCTDINNVEHLKKK